VNARQALYLKEMGLGPVWRLRAPPQLDAVEPALQDLPDLPEPAAESTPPVTIDRNAAIRGMEWAQLRDNIRSCAACRLHATRIQAVPGVGDEQADWLFVGEAPGADEDAQGEPFVGQAGKLLDNMLASIDLKRGNNVYIANVLKCRPPGNRNPLPEEVALCEPYLQRQVALINPKLIIALGKFAAQTLLRQEAKIADLRGQIHRYQDIPLIVTYHPAYLLRSLTEKAKAWQDLCLAVKTMQEL
jgi:uracil-DNA glycosylase